MSREPGAGSRSYWPWRILFTVESRRLPRHRSRRRREPNYLIEALVQYEWKPTRLEDSGRRTRIVADNQGRFYRVTDAADAAQVFASEPRRANLN